MSSKTWLTVAEYLLPLKLPFTVLSCTECIVKAGSASKMVYHGPQEQFLPFFESQGMHCPPCKADSDFLQEVVNCMSPASHIVIGPSDLACCLEISVLVRCNHVCPHCYDYLINVFAHVNQVGASSELRHLLV